MSKIKRICISYTLDRNNRTKYLFLSEFFRTIGIYVHEDIHDENKTNYEYIDYPIIVIGKVNILNKNIINYDSIDKKYKNKKDKLINLLSNLGINNIDFLVNTYVDNDIMMHMLDLQFYPKYQKYLDKKYEIYKLYNQIIESFDKIKNKNEYENYAYFYYIVRNAQHYNLSEYILEHEVRDVESSLYALSKKYDNTNFLVLLAIMYSLDKSYTEDATRLLIKKILKEEKEYPYASFINYSVAEIYNRYDEHIDFAKNYYQKSYENNGNIKSLYKIAKIEEKKKNYKEAIEVCKKLINSLNYKTEKQVLLPSEIRYMINSLYTIMYISNQKLQNRQGDVMNNGQKILRLADELKNIGIYKEIYGKKANAHISLSDECIYYLGIYQMLTGVYSEFNMPKESSYYRELMFKYI